MTTHVRVRTNIYN